MAPFTLPQDATFPTGTSVSAYLHDGDTEGQPSGSPLDTQTMNGSVTFNGLVEGRAYWAIGNVGGQLRRKEFYVPVTPVVNVKESELQIFNVLNYGAQADCTTTTGADGYPTPTGGTDNTPLAQSAIDAAVAARSGEVRFPKGDYYFHATRNASGIFYHLIIYGDNVRIVLEQGARLFSDAGVLTAFFIQMGWAKGDTPAAAAARGGVLGDQWRVAYWHAQTAKPIAAVSKGARTLSFTTHADAAIPAGHALKILTGVEGAITTPDSEVNESAGGDAGTGVLTLRRPATRHYEQEWVASQAILDGTDNGFSTRSATAFPAPFGVIDIESTCIRGGGLSGEGEIHGVNLGTALRYYSILDGPICRPFPKCINIGAYNGQDSRDAIFAHPYMDLSISSTAYGQSTGCTGARHLYPVMRNRTGIVTFEASEGSSGWKCIHPKHENAADAGADQRSFSLGLRNRDCLLLDPDVLNHPPGNAIIAQSDPECPELADSPSFIIRPHIHGVVGSPGRIYPNGGVESWHVIDDLSPDPSNRIFIRGSDHSDLAPRAVQSLNGQVAFTDGNTAIHIGRVPINCKIIDVDVQRSLPFNAGTTNRLDVGWVGATQAIVNNADLTGSWPGKLPLALTSLGKQGVARDIVVTYRYTGTAPTSGILFIAVRFIASAINPNA